MNVQSTFYNVRVHLDKGKRLSVYKDARDSEPTDVLRSVPNEILRAQLSENGWLEFREPGKSFWLPFSGNNVRNSLEQAWDNDIVSVWILVGGSWKLIDSWSQTKQVDL